ncbi:MAG: response regulator transcription factor [Deltaproteobacteria bacterium]|nr:response regulator transcription factor [Deltaproteobacteria bacterium]
MKSKTPKEDNPTQGALGGKSIWIIGPRKLQNELLAELLTGKTGAQCACAEDLNQALARHAPTDSHPDLFLFDCLGIELDRGLKLPGEERLRPGPEHLAALFNVRYGHGIEERALREGIRGFFYENDPSELLQKGVKALFAGELWVSREIMSRCIFENMEGAKALPRDTRALTSREMEILSLISVGATNEQIGVRLCISTNTVKTHVYNIFHKIKVPNRLQAALWAAKHL